MNWYDNWVEIFKSGTHTDSQGNTREWTNEDLDAIVANYDPAIDEAPVVLGHPKNHDAPAYAWVCGLKREGDILFAKFERVNEEFALWVEKGLYRKISVSIGADLTLRHVGFLGAQNPAVKGLSNEFSMPLQAVREFFDDYKENKMFKKQSASEFAQRVNELEKELQSAQKATAVRDFGDFLGSLRSQAKITAEDKICLEKVFAHLSNSSGTSFFTQGEDDSLEADLFCELKNFLQNLPPRCEFSELATRENSPKGTYREPSEELGLKIAKSVQKPL